LLSIGSCSPIIIKQLFCKFIPKKQGMCFHVSQPKKDKLGVLHNHMVRLDEWDDYNYHRSGFEFKTAPVLTCEDPTRIQAFNWGLIPSWTKDHDYAKQSRLNCLNARAETIFEKPSFKTAIMQRRCLFYVDGFYEWRELNKKKYPYFIKLKHQDAFALGAIYERWVDTLTGETTDTTAIVTTAANPLMAKIHNVKLRMPLIFDKDTMMHWLEPNLNENQITELMQPFNENNMQAYTISKLITSRTENPNQPKTQEPFDYLELMLE
jgi:putative SOS response-associated peptidase YedK